MIKRILILGAGAFLCVTAVASEDVSDAGLSADNNVLMAQNNRQERRGERQGDRDDRQDCRQDEGRVGDDKRECKQENRGEGDDGDEAEAEAEGDA